MRQDKGKRAVAKHALAAKAAAAAREASLLKAALLAANLPLPDLTPLLAEDTGSSSGGAAGGEGGEGVDTAEDAEASAAEMVLVLRKEVASLKKELEASLTKAAAAAAMQPAAAEEEEEEEEVQAVVMLKDDPKFAKYFKMLSMHLPRPVSVFKKVRDILLVMCVFVCARVCFLY